MADDESLRACGLYAKVCGLDETQAGRGCQVTDVGNRKKPQRFSKRI